MSEASFHQETDIEASAPTLIEGLPGHGLVASIAVERITEQLELQRHGTIRSDAFPPVASFADGLVQDSVRVYAGTAPDVMTLQSDMMVPEEGYEALCQCVLSDLAERFERAIFLAAAPAQSESQHGTVVGVATNEDVKADVEAAGIEIAEEAGIIGGVTGALVRTCHHADVPAALLLVRADPYAPDPAAARAVIEEALEPLVEFDIETAELLKQAERIQQQKRQIAQQLQQAEGQQEPRQARSMFQ